MPSRRLWLYGFVTATVLIAGCRKPSAELGAVLFRKDCAGCHSVRPGRVTAVPSLQGYFERNPRPGIRQTRSVILDGRRSMPPFRNRLSRDELDDLIAYLETGR
jgi:mono/diheme cytochrome c family protein